MKQKPTKIVPLVPLLPYGQIAYKKQPPGLCAIYGGIYTLQTENTCNQAKDSYNKSKPEKPPLGKLHAIVVNATLRQPTMQHNISVNA